MTTVVVCGAAVLLVPSPCEGAAPAEPLDPVLSAASEEAPARSDAMNAARVTDPDPSDEEEDDDDDDAAPDAPATASDATYHVMFRGDGAVLVRDPRTGHRAPGRTEPPRPAAVIDETNIDDDDDDDDRLDSACSLLSAPIHLAHENSRLHSAPARRRSPDGPSLRAP